MEQEHIDYYNITENLMKITEKYDSVDQRTLYVEVILSKGPGFIPRAFPLLSCKNDEGIR